MPAFFARYPEVRIELDLNDRLVNLTQEGFDLAIRHTQTAPDTHVAWVLRESRSLLVASTAYLREHVASDASARFLVLTGNVHAMLAKPNRAPPEMQQPMGSYLVDLDPYSIKISANSGEFWGCTTSCSAKAVYPSQQSRALNAREYHFEVVLPEFSVARWLR